MTDSSNKAMPLRIALLAHSTGLSTDLLPATLQALPSADISINDNFEAALSAAIEEVNQGKVVRLTAHDAHNEQFSSSPTLILLAGLTAAQNKLHPHGYLAGFSHQEDATIEDSCERALSQARRKRADLQDHKKLSSLTSSQKFIALCEMIDDLSRRTLKQSSDDSKSNSAENSHYWFTEPHQARVASLSFTSEDQQPSSLILTQGTGSPAPKSLLSNDRLFFIISGNDDVQLQSQLTELIQALENQCPVPLMADNLRHYNPEAKQAIVLQATSIKALKQEISAISTALPKVFSEGTHYKTPAGSSFSPVLSGQNALGKAGLTFVYPGVGTVYGGMLNQLHQYFPDLYARLERQGSLKTVLQAEHIYGEDAASMSLSQLAIAGVGSSYLLTKLLCEEFKVQPNFALGYSKGEASMWASLAVWQDPHALIKATQTSPIFTTAISGELTAVREVWQLKEDEEIQWNSFVVRSESQAIEALLPDFPHVYLAIIQGDTCVIAGCENECRALLKVLGKRGIAANRVTAMHTVPAHSQHAEVVKFYHQPLCETLPEHISFISAASNLPTNSNGPIKLDSQSIADSIADTFCATLDFTALIQNARRQGANLFVEVGADRQTSTLIDKINRADNVSNQSCTVAVNAKGSDDVTALLKCIGQLISHRVPLSIEPLLSGLAQSSVQPTTSPEPILKGEPV